MGYSGRLFYPIRLGTTVVDRARFKSGWEWWQLPSIISHFIASSHILYRLRDISLVRYQEINNSKG
jgi:hypothetical protein